MNLFLKSILTLIVLTQFAYAGFLDNLNSKVNSVNNITDGASRIKGNTVDKYSRSESNDKKRLTEWKNDLKIGEKAMNKVCQKKIAVEFDSARFKNFLSTNDSPGAFCADAVKALEFDVCPELNYRKKVTQNITSIKCVYTSKSDPKLKMKLNDKILMIGFGESTTEIYDESNLWFQKNLLKNPKNPLTLLCGYTTSKSFHILS